MKLFQTKHITVSIAKTSHREKLEGLVFWGLLLFLVIWRRKW
ncbi:hypothetical protein O209_10390 [Lactiplantibacillus plantarum WHE 92]|nr:hypothetical protein O209_10390 [Lactiplantibacillus plantarum WHE 92]